MTTKSPPDDDEDPYQLADAVDRARRKNSNGWPFSPDLDEEMDEDDPRRLGKAVDEGMRRHYGFGGLG